MKGNQHIYVSHCTCVKHVTQSKTHPLFKKSYYFHVCVTLAYFIVLGPPLQPECYGSTE